MSSNRGILIKQIIKIGKMVDLSVNMKKSRHFLKMAIDSRIDQTIDKFYWILYQICMESFSIYPIEVRNDANEYNFLSIFGSDVKKRLQKLRSG